MEGLYHGTTQIFEAFSNEPAERNTPSASHTLGVFLSTCPRIAAHYTLKTEVIDQGYDSWVGSSTLRENPWQFSEDPFLPNATVLQCQALIENPIELSAVEWVGIVEGLDAAEIGDLREKWIRQGFDGVRIVAWDGVSEHPEFGVPCVEMHAECIVVFDAAQVDICQRSSVEQHWEPRPNRPQLRRSM